MDGSGASGGEGCLAGGGKRGSVAGVARFPVLPPCIAIEFGGVEGC